MAYAAILLPLLFAGLFIIAAVHAELAHPRHFPRLAAPVRAPARIPMGAPVDPGVIVALNAADFERLYSAPAMATWARGADRL